MAGKDLYVRNIDHEVTEEELRKLFAVCGKVSRIHMVRDAASGAFVGCAYVTMGSEAQAKDALVTLDGALLGRRPVLVSAARPREPKKPGRIRR